MIRHSNSIDNSHQSLCLFSVNTCNRPVKEHQWTSDHNKHTNKETRDPPHVITN